MMSANSCFVVNKLKKMLLAGFVALPLVATVFSVVANASSYTVGPLLTIADLKSSQARGTINVTNAGKESIRLRIYVEDFTYDRNNGFTSTSSHPYSAIQYLQFTPKELVIPPLTTRNVRINILISPNAPDGEYRAIIFAEELKTEAQLQQQQPVGGATFVKTRIGSIFYVSKGNTNSDIKAIGVGWDSEKKQPQIILENKGSATFNPGIEWKIERDGKEVDNGIISGILVQNRSERAASLNTKKAGKLSPGDYTVSGQVTDKGGVLKPFSFKFKVPNWTVRSF